MTPGRAPHGTRGLLGPCGVQMDQQNVTEALQRMLSSILPDGLIVGRDTRLGSTGLSSLTAARLWLEIQDEFGADIPLSALSGDATVSELADAIACDSDAGGARSPVFVRADPDARREPFPLTPIQQAYLTGTYPELTADPVGCHQYLEFEVEEVNPERLQSAWRRLIDRHDMLRAVVTSDGRQRVLDHVPEWAMPVDDLTRARPHMIETHVAAVRRRLSHSRYTPGSWPSFAVELCVRPNGVGLVHLSLDGLFADGHGMAVLLAEWANAYRRPDEPLKALILTARDCVVAHARNSVGERYERDLGYWLDQLRDMPPGPAFAPPHDPRTGGAGYERRALTERLHAAQWSRLRERARACGVSPASLVLTVFVDAIARAGARSPFSLVLTTSGRAWLPAEAADIVGPFTSSTIIVAEAPADEPLTAAAPALHEQVWRALDHSTVSGIDALREIRTRGHDLPEALPVVFTSMLDVGPGGRSDVGFAADVTYALSQTSDVVIDNQIWEQGDELHFRWDTAIGRLPAGTAETAFAWFVNGLYTTCAPPEELPPRPLNALQQAYFVARSDSDDEPWNGCQIYETFYVPELDSARLADALLRLIQANEALRSWVDRDGVVRTRAAAPAGWHVPVIDLADVVDPAAVLTAVRDEMVGRGFPLGRWPQFDVRVTVGAGPPTVHCAFDVALHDAPSVHFLCRELLRLYEDPDAAARASGDSRIADRGALRSNADRSPSQSHWEERTADLPAGPVLPGRAHAADDVGRDQRRVRLEGRLPGWRRLVRYATEHGLSPDTMLLAAFTAVLAEELEQHDFAVPVVRWSDADDQCRPGEFTRLSWMRAATTGESRRAAATRYHREMAEDLTADGVEGLAVLRRRIMRERAQGAYGYPVVYSSVVDLTDWPLPAGVRPGPWMSCTPEVALDCIGTADGDELFYCWDAVAGEFPPGWLASAFARYGQMLQSLTADTAIPRVHAGTLSRGEYRRIVHAWNDTGRDFATHRLAHALFEDRARARPDAPAVHSAAGVVTYGELNDHANRIAWRLRELGVGPETIVAVTARRGPAMVAGVLGVLKAGGAYLPVEPSLPRDRALTMLRRTGASLMLTTSDTRRAAAPDDVTVIEIDRDPGREDPTDRRGEDPPHVAGPGDTAYVIFTSGSTGTPKGVAVPHRALSNLLDWCKRTFRFGPDDVGLGVTSLGFDLSVLDILGLLGYGSGLYVADEEQQKDPALLLDVLLREPVTFWNSAPTTLAQLAPLLAGVRGDPAAEWLRLVFLSGDYTPLWLPDEVRAAFPNARIVSLGGATEATVWSNYFPIDDVDPDWRSIPYGRPIDNARYYILDAASQPCGVGEEGELYIAGECLSAGYYGEPALTADRFAPDPFSIRPGQRMYHTGDRASYCADGTIRFFGRVDGQVKIRGFRVELGEIEHRLRQHAEVKDVVVAARADDAGDSKLVAYVVPASARPPSTSELREHAALTLPDYMVPNFVSLLDSLPGTANGKVDRDALPWPVPQPAAGPAAAPAQPAGPTLDELQKEITVLFAELLGQALIDPRRDIWDQGATSFTLVQVSNALQQRYQQRVPVSAVLAEPTVAGIAWHLHTALGLGEDATGAASISADAAPPPAREPAAVALPPSPVDFFSAQEREEFKARHWNIRSAAPRDEQVQLAGRDVTDELYVRRGSRRDFLDIPVSGTSLGRLLSVLRESVVGGRARYLYPSAGDTYAVQVYVHVKPDGVEGVPPGTYYYRASQHVLERVGDGSALDRSMHFVYNRPLYDAAAFELYLLGQTRAIAPLYREHSERYLAIEAGHMGQLLMMAQAELGLGLCPIGEVSFDRLRTELASDDGHRFLLGFVGGRAEHRFSSPRIFPDEPDAQAQIVVVGMSGRYPGADDPDALWRNLAGGVRSIRPVPAHRGVPAPELLGGFLESVDEFDSLLFQISPAEARSLDPQLRLLLQAVWECLEHAGHTAASLRRTAPRTSVFVAAMWHDYELVGAETARRTGVASASATASDIPNRISHFFDFTGPSVAVDTSCSSSLTALHLAVESLRRGECDAAVVAAANLLVHPYHAQLLAAWGLTASGASAAAGAFDAQATGWVAGEGVGALLLRRAGTAAADRETIHAVIEGTWTGHSGRAGRFGVPMVEALQASVSEALAHMGLTAADIDYVECAAAGSSVADSAEIEALARVFGGARRSGDVPIGTLKQNIGHLEAASGLSQLTKVILQLRHRRIAPTLLARELNPLLPWADLPVRLVDRVEEWDGAAPRRALVNAVGAAGSYSHAVVRTAPASAPLAAPRGPHAVLLSAASPEQLRASAARLRGYLEVPQAVDLGTVAEIAFTLQTGRVHHAHRLAVSCDDVATLRVGLDAYLDDHPHPAVHTAGIAPPPELDTRPRSESDAVTWWLSGHDVDWNAYWPEQPRRVPLPTYPFARESHWVDAAPEPRPAPANASDVVAHVCRLYAQVSGIPVERIDPHVPLEHYGLNSALVVQLNQALERDFGEVSRTLFFEHQTLDEVADHLSARGAAARRPPSQPARSPDDDIAVIGIAGRYPQAKDVEQFWRLLEEGRDCITPLPEDRRRPGWPTELMWGSFLDEVDRFDPLFFGIAPRDADLMDPQERLFLEVVWEALEDAGYPRTRLREAHGGRVGVFAATMYNDYPFFGVEQSLAGKPVSTGSSVAGIANRVSYFLDLSGPSLTVDTMCSSSLTAIHLAVASLRLEECELAVAGGVNLSLHPNKFIEQARLKMTSGDHRCRAFGAGGDGFAPGEGVGAVVLKPLPAAIAAGDRVHAVIKATAVNHGGKTNGYTVPNPVAQGELVADAIAQSGVPPGTIGYVEAHGTGTALGDPVEINGLERAFAAAGLQPGTCAIGSVKSNIGHLEGAAGIAGLTKVVLQMRHRRLVPTLHADDPNPNVDWARSPFRLQREPGEWPALVVGGHAVPRRAGISSFGAGGANAHVVVEAFEPTPDRRPVVRRPQLIVLSARDEERLRALAARLAEYLESGLEQTNGPLAALDEIGYTLQVGREPLRERLAVVGSNHRAVADALNRVVAGETGHVIRGQAPPSADTTPTAEPVAPDRLDEAALADVGKRWVRGEQVDWPRLHPDGRPPLVSLPSYPFARRRHWLPEPEPAAPGPVSLYAKTWQPASEPSPAASTPPLVCLYASGSEALAHRFAEVVGSGVTLVREGAAFSDEQSAVAAVRDLLARELRIEGYVDLCDLNRGDEAAAPWTARLGFLKELLAQRPRLRALLVVEGLQDLPGPQPSLDGARMAGFVRALDAEYGRLRATVVDVDAAADRPDEVIRQVLVEIAADDGRAEVCYRDGQRYRPHLTPVEAAPATPVLDPAKAYVITGGTGGIGSAVAAHLCRCGARRIVLLGLRPVRARSQWDGLDLTDHEAAVVNQIRELEERGAQVALYSGSLTDRARLGDFLADVRASLGEVGGVVHCAGRMPDVGPFIHKDLDDVRAVLEPKVDGVEALWELCEMDRLSFFVTFSSVAALVPRLAAGLVDYAAANAFLDFFAGHRARTGRPEVRSVAWPSWGGIGMTARAGVDVGLRTLDVDEGLDVLDTAIAGPLPAAVIVAPVRDPRFDPQTLLGGASTERPCQGSPAVPPAPALAAHPALAPASVPEWLTQAFAETIGVSPTDLDPTVQFGDLGVESVLLGELVTKIEARVGGHVEPSSLIAHPTLEQLAVHLVERFPETRETAADPAASPDPATGRVGASRRPRNLTDEDRVAVIGLACRFPGAPDAATFWANLRTGHCAITEVPPSRWDAAALYRPVPEVGKTISKWGGFLDDIEDFDADFFGLSDEEATCLDPGIRLMLEVVTTALRDAGYADDEVDGRDVGVFVGGRVSDYRQRVGIREGSAGFGTDQNFLAARVAQQFNLTGPNMVVDSACSSGLVAVQLAARSLVAGESELALAGSVDVLLDEWPYLEFSAVQALSPSGRCRTFDQSANGFVPGEGCGVVLLKRLGRALADGDRIRAVIDAAAVGNDGRTMGLTTPNPVAQAAVVRRALRDSGRLAEEIGMVEAHGTGTMIGDPIELQALTTVFRETTNGSGFCAIGSVKSNVGHLLSAAGIAGLLKALLSLEHGEIPPTLFCEVPNPRFDFGNSPFFPNTQLRLWPDEPGLRVAGVSAFGLGGTNAHVIASALDPAILEGPARREPLPAPRFRRRRLWLDPPAGRPAPASTNGLVASLLELDFDPDLEPAESPT